MPNSSHNHPYSAQDRAELRPIIAKIQQIAKRQSRHPSAVAHHIYDMLREARPDAFTAEDWLAATAQVAKTTGIPQRILLSGQDKTRPVAYARAEAFAILTEAGCSYYWLAKLSGFNHSSIRYSIEQRHRRKTQRAEPLPTTT